MGLCAGRPSESKVEVDGVLAIWLNTAPLGRGLSQTDELLSGREDAGAGNRNGRPVDGTKLFGLPFVSAPFVAGTKAGEGAPKTGPAPQDAYLGSRKIPESLFALYGSETRSLSKRGPPASTTLSRKPS